MHKMTSVFIVSPAFPRRGADLLEPRPLLQGYHLVNADAVLLQDIMDSDSRYPSSSY